MNKVLIALLFLVLTKAVFAQHNSEAFRNMLLADEDLDNTDIKKEFVQHDISSLLTQTNNSIVFGFIGDNYQRIRIKLISVSKNPENPYQYMVYGKSMVRDNICEFQGTITITSAFYLKHTQSAAVREGRVIGEYLFNENPQQKHVGRFKGVFSSNWYIQAGKLRYNDLADEADGFANNQFAGTWTNYSGTVTKPCHWGDHRIPMSGDLDDGTGEFHPAKKYQANGWLTYQQAYAGGATKEQAEQARHIEQKEWWK